MAIKPVEVPSCGARWRESVSGGFGGSACNGMVEHDGNEMVGSSEPGDVGGSGDSSRMDTYTNVDDGDGMGSGQSDTEKDREGASRESGGSTAGTSTPFSGTEEISGRNVPALEWLPARRRVRGDEPPEVVEADIVTGEDELAGNRLADRGGASSGVATGSQICQGPMKVRPGL